MNTDWNSLLEIEDPLKKRLVLVGLLTRELSEFDIVPIIIGGNALEFYTLGGYTTQDIDLVCSDPEKAGLILEQHGFLKEGRHWVNEELLLAIEIPATHLIGSLERLERVEIGDLVATIIAKEDLLIDRLNACVHWNSAEDCRWALELLVLYQDTLDWNYLDNRAIKEDVATKLQKLQSKVPEMAPKREEMDLKK